MVADADCSRHGAFGGLDCIEPGVSRSALHLYTFLNMPSVGIDARMWDHPGIGRYVRELAYGLKGLSSDLSVICLKSDALTSKIYSLTEQWEVYRKAQAFDLLHVPNFNVPILRKRRFVATIHDLTYVHEPSASGSLIGRKYAQSLLGHIAKHAQAVIAVSEYTKNDFLNAFPAARSDRIIVTHEAASAHFKYSPDTEKILSFRKKFNLEKPFVLFVGSLKPHKNIAALLEAMKRVRAKHGLDHELVIVGKEDAKRPEILKAVRSESFCRYLGSLADEDLLWAYHAADLFVLPSLREGFGLPLLEAMACGCPVLASDRTSLPEIVGDAGKTFDPERIDGLSDLIYNVLRDNELRKKMSRMGLDRVKHFSWKKLAEDTLRVYERALA